MYLFLHRVVGPILCDVQLGESGLTLVIFRLVRLPIIPYSRIASVHEMTKWQFWKEAWSERAGMGGVINRGNPILVIRRTDKSRLFACSPRDRKAFVAELEQRIWRARHATRFAVPQTP